MHRTLKVYLGVGIFRLKGNAVAFYSITLTSHHLMVAIDCDAAHGATMRMQRKPMGLAHSKAHVTVVMAGIGGLCRAAVKGDN